MSRPPAAPAGLAALVAILAMLITTVAAAHHVGAYTPRDNEISANFKQLKFSLQARKLEVALRLYDGGALRRELRARAATLPAGLDDAIRAAFRAGDVGEVERGLMVFFVALTRDLALEADRQLADPSLSTPARAAIARKFLEAIWRYYNLVDFAVTQRDAKAAAAVRLAVDEAEGDVKDTATPAAPTPPPDRIREPFRQIARVLAGVIETSSSSTRRNS